jgi:transcriptional regulator with XRE-family HTH domain
MEARDEGSLRAVVAYLGATVRPLFTALAHGRSVEEIASASGLTVGLTRRLLSGRGRLSPRMDHVAALWRALGGTLGATYDALEEARRQYLAEEPLRKEHLRRTAYHEAGHATVARLVGVRFSRVSIIANEDSNGRLSTRAKPRCITAEDRRRHREKEVLVAMGGSFGGLVLAQLLGAHDPEPTPSDRGLMDALLPEACRPGECVEDCKLRLVDEFNGLVSAETVEKLRRLAEALLVRRSLCRRDALSILGEALAPPATEAA